MVCGPKLGGPSVFARGVPPSHPVIRSSRSPGILHTPATLRSVTAIPQFPRCRRTHGRVGRDRVGIACRCHLHLPCRSASVLGVLMSDSHPMLSWNHDQSSAPTAYRQSGGGESQETAGVRFSVYDTAVGADPKPSTSAIRGCAGGRGNVGPCQRVQFHPSSGARRSSTWRPMLASETSFSMNQAAPPSYSRGSRGAATRPWGSPGDVRRGSHC